MNLSLFRDQLGGYVELRRALGFSMQVEERMLKQFIRYIESHADAINSSTAQLAVDWTCSIPIRSGSGSYAARMSVVRGFLAYLQASLPEIHVPSHNLIAAARRPKPHIFSTNEIHDLMDSAGSLGPKGSLRPFTYVTLIGVLLSCGLRPGEAMRLPISDVFLDDNSPHLVVRETKFRKSRVVPMSPTTLQALRTYAMNKKRLGYDRYCDSFFVSESGRPLIHQTVARTFIKIARNLGIRGPVGERGASLHSLRHTFAVWRVLAWYREGLDVQALLPKLSVYLGHVSPQESYWYLTATPELLSAAAVRFESYSAKGAQP